MIRVTKLARYEIDMNDFRKVFPNVEGKILSIRYSGLDDTVDVEVEV